MRCKNIQFEITMPVDNPDSNGVKFKESAIIGAVDNFDSGIPFIRYDYNGTVYPIGFVDTLEYKDGKLIAKGFAWAGGFEIVPIEIENETITKMKFKGMGFDE